MKKELKMILSAMASLILVAVVCAMPVTLPNNLPLTSRPLRAQSVSGKIASVEKTSFTLTIGPGHAVTNPGHQFQESSAKIDDLPDRQEHHG